MSLGREVFWKYSWRKNNKTFDLWFPAPKRQWAILFGQLKCFDSRVANRIWQIYWLHVALKKWDWKGAGSNEISADDERLPCAVGLRFARFYVNGWFARQSARRKKGATCKSAVVKVISTSVFVTILGSGYQRKVISWDFNPSSHLRQAILPKLTSFDIFVEGRTLNFFFFRTFGCHLPYFLHFFFPYHTWFFFSSSRKRSLQKPFSNIRKLCGSAIFYVHFIAFIFSSKKKSFKSRFIFGIYDLHFH